VQKYVISIDVGGTFTDCVIVEESGRVAHSAVEAAASRPGAGCGSTRHARTVGEGAFSQTHSTVAPMCLR
jgi:N-methylhydantoinase A/oxoprolinase/acetone carboxylase beta subunit